MASEKITAMIEEVKTLTVLELAELVHALEEEFGVSAAAAAVAAPAAGAAAAEVCGSARGSWRLLDAAVAAAWGFSAAFLPPRDAAVGSAYCRNRGNYCVGWLASAAPRPPDAGRRVRRCLPPDCPLWPSVRYAAAGSSLPGAALRDRLAHVGSRSVRRKRWSDGSAELPYYRDTVCVRDRQDCAAS